MSNQAMHDYEIRVTAPLCARCGHEHYDFKGELIMCQHSWSHEPGALCAEDPCGTDYAPANGNGGECRVVDGVIVEYKRLVHHNCVCDTHWPTRFLYCPACWGRTFTPKPHHRWLRGRPWTDFPPGHPDSHPVEAYCEKHTEWIDG